MTRTLTFDHLLKPGDEHWPSLLAELTNEPQQLWINGQWPMAQPSIAIVGSRNATVSGLEIAYEFAYKLAACGVVVVSGMARGIDAAAHRGALAAKGATLAVLGCGIDVCYPPEHLDLRAEIAQRGAVISEFPLGMLPLPHNFPLRNRLIAALSLGTIVVEASFRSGALSTARKARDLGREVLVVPGSIRNHNSQGTNLLIRDGALLMLQLEDALQAIPELRVQAIGLESGTPINNEVMDPLLTSIGTEPVHPDHLAAILREPVEKLNSRLSELELSGQIRRLPGGLVTQGLASE